MELTTILFLMLVALGAMVQTITGFAMGLIIIGGVTALGLADIGVTAAVISLITLVNTSIALRQTYRNINFRFVLLFTCGSLPMVVVGVYLLELMSGAGQEVLATALGVVIIVAGSLLMAKPEPYEKVTHPVVASLVAGTGGLIGGLYGAGGAPLAYLMYRQPLELMIIRATLLASFSVSTIVRTVSITAAGQIDDEVLALFAFSLPVVILVTLLGTKIAPKLPDALIRKFVFILLILLGLFLIFR